VLSCVTGPAQENGLRPQAQLVAVLKHVLLPKKGSDGQAPPDEHPEAHRALDLLLGLASTKGLNSVTRRTRAKNYLHDDIMLLDTFNKRHTQPLLDLLADELIEYDTTYRMRDTHERLAGKLPASPALAVLWLDRFQYYYRMWSDLSGLINDLAVYLRARHDPATTNTQLERRRRTSLWYLARFFLHLDQFMDQRGGLWLLGDEDQAQLVADSTYFLRFHPPVTEHDASWLSSAALERPVPAFHLFNSKLDEDDTGRLILGRWRVWLEACQCDDQGESEDCEVHIVMRHCERYIEVIDAEWNRVVEWFTGPPGKSLITPEQVAEVNQRWRLPADLAVDQQANDLLRNWSAFAPHLDGYWPTRPSICSRRGRRGRCAGRTPRSCAPAPRAGRPLASRGCREQAPRPRTAPRSRPRPASQLSHASATTSSSGTTPSKSPSGSASEQ